MNRRTHGSYIPFDSIITRRQKKVIIKTRKEKPIWDLMKYFINYRAEIGEKFTRKDMLEYIYPDPNVCYYMRRNGNTLDSYRCLLAKVKIIKNTDDLGIYTKLRDIPNRLTTTRLKKIAEDRSWKSWFVPFDEKI